MPAKKAVLATFGTLGDIYPFVALAAAFEARGFDTAIVAPDTHRGAIDAEGLRYVAMRPNDRAIAAASGIDEAGAFRLMLRNPHFILDAIYMRFLRETFEDVRQAASGADIVVTHSLLVGANLAAETLAVPTARIALAPLHLQSAHAPSLTPGAPYRLQPRRRVEVAFNRVVRRAVRAVTNARMGALRAFRRELGLPRSREDLFLDFGRANGAARIFGLYAPHFAPVQPDHPRNLVLPGFPFHASRDPRRRTLDPALARFLAEGEPPVVFTLGSFAPLVSGDFYDRSLRAARACGLRAVLLAGDRDAARLATHASADAFICAGAPHASLFPQARYIVHHGGIGTTAEAMRAGKPQLVVPFFGDQHDHGARVQRLGLGRSIALARYDEAAAVSALRALVSGEHDHAARRSAALVAGRNGVDAVADWAVRTVGPNCGKHDR